MKTKLLLPLLLLCSVAMAQRQSDITALDNLIQATSDKAQVRELTLRKATLLKRMYCFDEAVDALSGLLAPEEMDVELLGEIADCHFQAGNVNEAAGLYRLLMQLQPDNIGFQVRYISLAYRAKAYPEVVERGEELLSRQMVTPVTVLVGDALVKLEHKDSALVHYGEALRRKPRNAPLVNKIADIYLTKKDYDTTLALANSYLELDPDDFSVRRIKGLALYLKDNYAASLDVFEPLKADGDSSYGIFYYLGQNYLHIHQLTEAENAFCTAWEIDSSDVNLAVTIGTVKSRLPRDYGTEVKPWFEKALEMMQPDPKTLGNIYQNYALTEFQRLNWDRAITLYKKAYQHDPAIRSCLSTIAYCYEMKKDYKNALTWYEKYLAVAKPGSENYQWAEASVKHIKAELFMEQ